MPRAFWIIACAALALLCLEAQAGENRDDGKREWREGDAYVMNLTLQPAPEPTPALKYRLTTRDLDLLDRNAAVYYLKAMGYLEQRVALQEVMNRIKKGFEDARKQGKGLGPPYEWLEMSLEEMPLDDVKQFLSLVSFQRPFLREAARCRRCDFENDIRDAENPIGVLLPDVQSMRELARYQTLRFKVALREHRFDEALEIMRENYMMARHMSEHDCIVTCLVGMAVAGMTNTDQSLLFIQQPGAPNLYWALSAMPRPLIDMRPAWSTEGELLYLQIPPFKEVNEAPQSIEYWQTFADRLIDPLGQLVTMEYHQAGVWFGDHTVARTSLTSYCIAAYPGAKRYLIETCRMSPEQVEAYPIAQVVALAVVRSWDQLRDEELKWVYVPRWQAEGRGSDLMKAFDEIGPASALAYLLIPAMAAAREASVRTERDFAMLQTVESLRMYGAGHNGKFPRSLDELELPAPVDPYTNRPFQYRVKEKTAVLESVTTGVYKRRWILRFAESE
ncbi:MAG: hypothetical protein ACYTG0_26235 [Planctomycetota bacterium]|jgi:hypothetical protein